MYTLLETIGIVRDLGKVKSDKTFIEKTILSMIAGAAVAFGHITYFIAREQVGGGMGFIIGASLFPIGLMIVLMAGGELLTGNMMVVGAFVNLFKGTDGLLHISKIDHKRIDKVEDVLNLGDIVKVKITEIDDRGRVNVSRKDLLPKPEKKPVETKEEK